MPAPLTFLPISSSIRRSRSMGMRPIHDLASASSSSSRCSMPCTGTASSLAVLWLASSRMARPPRILPDSGPGRPMARMVLESGKILGGLEHRAADGADGVLQTQLVGISVVVLGTGELAEPDGNHLEEAAFDFAHEIGVPLHAAGQQDAIAFVGVAV